MTDGRTSGCAGHGGLSAEARALARAVLDRVEPLLDGLRSEPVTSTGEASTGEVCTGCPVCVVLAVLRGESPEPAVRLAEQAAAIVAVLRAALEEGDPEPRPSGPAPPAAQAASSRTVQRIHVERATSAR